MNMDQMDGPANAFGNHNTGVFSPQNTTSTPQTNQSNRVLFMASKYIKNEAGSDRKIVGSELDIQPTRKLKESDDSRSNNRWGFTNERKVQFGEKQYENSAENQVLSEPRSQGSSIHNNANNGNNTNNINTNNQNVCGVTPHRQNINALQSANQIISLKNAKMLSRKLIENQQIQSGIAFSSQQGVFNGRRPGSETGTMSGWANLKKRIESLKHLMRNIEMSGMIQVVSKLRIQHIGIIQDLASDFGRQIQEPESGLEKSSLNRLEESVGIERCLKRISLFFLRIFAKVPTINNQMMIVVSFKIILALQLLYQIFLLPLMVSFPETQVNLFSSKHPILRIWFVLPFIFEIMLNFNLSYYENGERITAKYLIITRYLKKEFWWDVSGLIGTALLLETIGLLAIFIIFSIRFIKFQIMYETIEEKFQLSLRFAVPYTLLNLFLSMTLVAHICGCIFQWIAYDLSDQGQKTWLTANNLFHASISDRYIASLYFSFITMISVGYGDIVPITNSERIFVIFMTIFSCGVFAYVVSSISELFESMYNKDSHSKQQKYEVSNYMETRKIDSELQTKVFQYLQMLHTKKQQEPESGQGILEKLNPKLRESIYQNYYGRHLKGWRLFSSIFSESFLQVLSIQCKEQVFGPGEIIYYQQPANSDRYIASQDDGNNNFNEESQYIYLIIQGTVLVFEDMAGKKHSRTKNNRVYHTKYTAGESIGIKEFFCGTPHEFTAQSKGLTTLIKVQRSDFLDVLTRFPKDYESFAQLRDEITFNHPDKYTKCEPCNRYDHSLYSCPRMHFSKRQLKTIYSHLHSEPQERRKIETVRIKMRFHAAGEQNALIKEQLKIYRVRFVNSIIRQNYEKSKENAYDQYYQSDDGIGDFDGRSLPPGFGSLEGSPSFGSNGIIPRSPQLAKAGSIDRQVNFTSIAEQAKLSMIEPQLTKRNKYDESDEIELSVDSVLDDSRFRSRSRTVMVDSQAQEILEYADEEQDEIFFFKCPMLVWLEDEKRYVMSLEDDEEQGNAAIQHYLESHFDVFINEAGNFAYPLDDFSEEQSVAITDNYSNNEVRYEQRGPTDKLDTDSVLLEEITQEKESGQKQTSDEQVDSSEKNTNTNTTTNKNNNNKEDDLDVIRISADSLSYSNMSVPKKKPIKPALSKKGTIDIQLGDSIISDYDFNLTSLARPSPTSNPRPFGSPPIIRRSQSALHNDDQQHPKENKLRSLSNKSPGLGRHSNKKQFYNKVTTGNSPGLEAPTAKKQALVNFAIDEDSMSDNRSSMNVTNSPSMNSRTREKPVQATKGGQINLDFIFRASKLKQNDADGFVKDSEGTPRFSKISFNNFKQGASPSFSSKLIMAEPIQNQNPQMQTQSAGRRPSSKVGWVKFSSGEKKEATIQKLRTLLSINDAKTMLTSNASPLRKATLLTDKQQQQQKNFTITNIGQNLLNSTTLNEGRSKSKTLASAINLNKHAGGDQQFQLERTKTTPLNNNNNLNSVTTTPGKQRNESMNKQLRGRKSTEKVVGSPGLPVIQVQFKGCDPFGDTSLSLKMPNQTFQLNDGESSPQNNFVPPSRIHFDTIKNGNSNPEVESVSVESEVSSQAALPAANPQKRIINNSSQMMQRSENYYQQLLKEGRKLSSEQIQNIIEFIFAFDKPHHFTNYFPKFNMNLVLRRYIKNQEQAVFAAHMNTITRPQSQRNIPRKQVFQKRSGIEKSDFGPKGSLGGRKGETHLQ